MPKIETYNFDENISDNDFLLGTDVDEDNKTKSYKIRTLINKIKAEVELTAFIQVETLPIEDIQLNTIYILPNGDWNYYNGTIWLSNSNRPYKVYTALLTQSGTDAPVATVLENTLGGEVVWTRDSEGFYFGTLNGVFLDNKTITLNSGIISQGDSFSIGTGILSEDIVYLSSKSLDSSNANTPIFKDLYTETPISIEIRVYN